MTRTVEDWRARFPSERERVIEYLNQMARSLLGELQPHRRQLGVAFEAAAELLREAGDVPSP